MMQNEWMKDPLVSGIAREKLEFLQMLVFEGQKLSKEQMLPFFMAVARKSQSQKISFDDKETQAIVTVLKKYASPSEIDKLNQLLSMKKR